ncbi:MAG: hypothetical protein KDA93_01920 [Planctomycetaceae bacterium]|nr:hypothetical protein [Planctomycetaceae bacterium]
MKTTRIALAFTFILGTCCSVQAGTQDDFFRALNSGQVKQLTQQMRPELLEQVDAPVLEAWMTAMNERLGRVRSIEQTSITNENKLTTQIESTEATVEFERGTATSTMQTADGKLIKFNVVSEQLGDDWFKGPTDTKIYEELGKTFINRFMKGQTDDAYAMCHPALQEVVDAEAFAGMVQQIQGAAGSLQQLTFKESRVDISEDAQYLLLYYDIKSEKATGTCEIKIQFVGLKGHLLGFDFE